MLPDSINEFVLMDVKALPTLFSNLIRYYHKIMVVTDALDECADRIVFLQKVKTMFRSAPGTSSEFFSS